MHAALRDKLDGGWCDDRDADLNNKHTVNPETNPTGWSQRLERLLLPKPTVAWPICPSDLDGRSVTIGQIPALKSSPFFR
jgi:hypothetical protein